MNPSMNPAEKVPNVRTFKLGSHCAITCDNFEDPIAKCNYIKHVWYCRAWKKFNLCIKRAIVVSYRAMWTLTLKFDIFIVLDTKEGAMLLWVTLYPLTNNLYYILSPKLIISQHLKGFFILLPGTEKFEMSLLRWMCVIKCVHKNGMF